MIEFAAVTCLIIAGIFAALWLRLRTRLREALIARESVEQTRAGLAAALGTVPLAGLWWRRDGAEESAIGRAPGGGAGPPYAGFLAELDSTDSARLGAAVDALRETGTDFTAAVNTTDGAIYQLHGRGTASGDSILWLADLSAQRSAEDSRDAAIATTAALREAFDAIPLPVWRRDRGLRLIDCNTAYAAALDTVRETVLVEGRELAAESGRDKARALARMAAAGSARNERRHVVIAGSRRLLEVCELPDRAGGTIGFAIDRTDVESAEIELARHINAHGQVLESIHAAVAIYGPHKRLSFFNSAFARLW
nr:PAS domain-containing protein [Stellaceae bacterium]